MSHYILFLINCTKSFPSGWPGQPNIYAEYNLFIILHFLFQRKKTVFTYSNMKNINRRIVYPSLWLCSFLDAFLLNSTNIGHLRFALSHLYSTQRKRCSKCFKKKSNLTLDFWSNLCRVQSACRAALCIKVVPLKHR